MGLCAGISRSCWIHLAEQLYVPQEEQPCSVLCSPPVLGFSRSCANLQGRGCMEDKEVLEGAVWALALSCPEAEAPTCAVCVLGHSGELQLCCGTCIWWEWFTNVLSECRRISLCPQIFQHSLCLLQFIRASLQLTQCLL